MAEAFTLDRTAQGLCSQEMRAKASSGRFNFPPPGVPRARDQMLQDPTVHSGQSKAAVLLAEKLGRSHQGCAIMSGTRWTASLGVRPPCLGESLSVSLAKIASLTVTY